MYMYMGDNDMYLCMCSECADLPIVHRSTCPRSVCPLTH